jgi:hypothetical protein
MTHSAHAEYQRNLVVSVDLHPKGTQGTTMTAATLLATASTSACVIHECRSYHTPPTSIDSCSAAVVVVSRGRSEPACVVSWGLYEVPDSAGPFVCPSVCLSGWLAGWLAVGPCPCVCRLLCPSHFTLSQETSSAASQSGWVWSCALKGDPPVCYSIAGCLVGAAPCLSTASHPTLFHDALLHAHTLAWPVLGHSFVVSTCRPTCLPGVDMSACARRTSAATSTSSAWTFSR